MLINVSFAGGYVLAAGVVPYCASKFYVGAFTEGLYHELAADSATKLRIKVFTPAATKSEFCAVVSEDASFDYDASFRSSVEQTAEFLLQLCG